MDPFDRQKLEEITHGERWLAEFPPPFVSEESLARIRRAVRQELSLRGSEAAERGRSAWQGVAVSAAAILLAVTIGWYSVQSETGAPAWELADSDFVEEISDTFVTFAAIDAEVTSLETVDDERVWVLSGAALYEAMEGALSEPETNDFNDTGAMRSTPVGIGRIEEA